MSGRARSDMLKGVRMRWASLRQEYAMAEKADLMEQALLWREPDRRGGGPVDHPVGEITLGSSSTLAVRVAALAGRRHAVANWSFGPINCGWFTSIM